MCKKAKDIKVGDVLVESRECGAGTVVTVTRGTGWIDDGQDGAYRIPNAVYVELDDGDPRGYSSYRLDPDFHEVTTA